MGKIVIFALVLGCAVAAWTMIPEVLSLAKGDQDMERLEKIRAEHRTR